MKTSDISNYEACRAYDEYHKRGDSFRGFVTDVLAEQFPGYPVNVLFSAMDRADDAGFVDYGVSLRTGWLTEEGKQLLAKGPQ